MNIKQWIKTRYQIIHYFIWSWSEPVPWIVDKKAKSVLDLGCGQGNPMKLIKKRVHIEYSVGVDLFEPYLAECRKDKVFSKLIKSDVRKVTFPKKSFDVVLLDEIIEHMSKKDALNVIKNAEKIAKHQVVIATPIGPCFHPAVDNNQLQLHKSYFYPEDFTKKGYKVIRYGWKSLLDTHSKGILYKINSPMLKRCIYVINIFLTPFYYLFQSTCDYVFVAYKQIGE